MKSEALAKAIKFSLRDVVSFPRISNAAAKVWFRNYWHFKQTWMVTAFWAVFEPVLYLFAIGLGLGQFVGQIEDVTYLEWFFPGLLATTAMMVSFFETTYGSFTKLNYQKTYAAILLTPVGPNDIIFGEILWATTKGMIGVIGVTLVGTLMGLVTDFSIVPALLVLTLQCFVFASLGMLVTSFATHYDSFIYAQSGFIMPMALFSGTYFPITQLPGWVKGVAYVLPLTHGVSAVRALLIGKVDGMVLANIGILGIMGIFVANWACARVYRKLIY